MQLVSCKQVSGEQIQKPQPTIGKIHQFANFASSPICLVQIDNFQDVMPSQPKAVQRGKREANMSTWLAERKDSLIGKYRSVIREKAIAQAKVEIALAGKYVTDYDQEQLEVIVKAQEDKIVQKYRNSTFVVLLLVLGIT
jgi:hypothetical protein